MLQTQPRRAPLARLNAGKSGRRLSGWRPPIETINQALINRGDMLLRRVREAALSNEYAARAVRQFSGYAVRGGIRPTFETTNESALRRLRRSWLDLVETIDLDDRDDFWGLQELVSAEVYAAGEVFVLRQPADNLAGFSVRLIPAEMCPFTKTMSNWADVAEGNEVRAGIEFEPSGRIAACHFYDKHPGDLDLRRWGNDGRAGSNNTTKRYPARDVLHIFRSKEAGQIRGISELAPGLIRMHQLDDYDDAELERQRTAALFCGFVKRAQTGEAPAPLFEGTVVDEDLPATEDVVRDELGALVDLQPGLLQELEPGDDITFSNPPQITGQYADFQKRNLQAIGSAWSVPYHVLTGDTSEANYSSARVAQLDFKVEVESFRSRCIVSQLCRGIRKWFLDGAELRGNIAEADREIRWHWNHPKWDWVDLVAESKASETEVRNGFTSRKRVVESRGNAFEDINREIDEDDFKPMDLRAPDQNQEESE